MRGLAYTLAGVAFIAALGFAGESDFNDEIRGAVHYCDMVAAGHWPDYEPNTNCAKVYASAAEHLTEGK